MKCLTRMYHDQGREVLFYENAAAPQRRPHAALVAVPIPYDLGATAPAFFREAMLAADEEWTQHAKVIELPRYDDLVDNISYAGYLVNGALAESVKRPFVREAEDRDPLGGRGERGGGDFAGILYE